MSTNLYQAPESKPLATTEAPPVAVEKPKSLYLVAIFYFFILVILTKGIKSLLVPGGTGDNGQILQLALFLYLLTLIALPIGVAIYNRYFLLLCGVVMALAAFLMTFSFVTALVSGSYAGITLISVPVLLALLSLSAWFCLRKKTQDGAKMYAAFKKQAAMNKEVQKRLAGR